MEIYHFNLGDSVTGPVGIRASITAKTQRRAEAILKNCLPDEIQISPVDLDIKLHKGEGINYIRADINSEKIAAEDIDSITPVP